MVYTTYIRPECVKRNIYVGDEGMEAVHIKLHWRENATFIVTLCNPNTNVEKVVVLEDKNGAILEQTGNYSCIEIDPETAPLHFNRNSVQQ